jgi:hypothetical protein
MSRICVALLHKGRKDLIELVGHRLREMVLGLDHGPSAATGLRDDIRRGFECGIPAARNDQQGDGRPLDLTQLPLERRLRRDPSSGKALAKPFEFLGVLRTPQFGGDAH